MAVETGPRRHRGRFDGNMDDAALLAAVGDVLRHARPDAPAKVAQRRFDAARSPAGHPACPSARAIAMRFNEGARRKFSWEQVKQLALDPERNVTQTLAAARREEPAEHLDERHVFFALRFVSQRSGLEAPTRDQYADARAKLPAAARRHDDQTLADLLPTVGQVEHLFDGDWDAALAAADLVRVKPKAVPPPRAVGMPPAEVAAHFVRANRWWPIHSTLYDFAREAGIRMARFTEPMEKIRADAAALLAAEGIATLTPSPPGDARTRTWRLPPAASRTLPRAARTSSGRSPRASKRSPAGCARCRPPRRPPRPPTSRSPAASPTSRRPRPSTTTAAGRP
jgi:hypothetical protein